MCNSSSRQTRTFDFNYTIVLNKNALNQNEMQQMFQKTHNLFNLGIVPVGHSDGIIWVFLEKEKLPPQKCPKHGNIMKVLKTENNDPHHKEGTLYYRCNVNGCLENVCPIYSRHQLNQDLTTDNPPAILY